MEKTGYEEQLFDLLNTLNETRNQVLQNSEAANQEICEAFTTITKSVLENVDKRKNELLKRVECIKENTLGPLDECKAAIECQLKCSKDIAQNNDRSISRQQTNGNCHNPVPKIPSELTSTIDCLPEIPKASDIPAISVHFDALAIQQCLTGILYAGHVSFSDPVKIVESREKPAALAIAWEDLDADFSSDLQNVQFCLQYCKKGESSEERFIDVYVGADKDCVVRDLKPNCDYCFRVCRLGTEVIEWSPVYVARTTILPYEWESSNEGAYELADERRTATKISPTACTIHSTKPQYGCGHSLQFLFLECRTKGRSDEGLGLSLRKICDGSTIGPGTLFVNFEGCVFVDGIKMSTRLPRLCAGSALTFESEEELANSKMRVMITCEEKRVTYDWRIEGAERLRPAQDRGIYFFMHFHDEGWRVKVE